MTTDNGARYLPPHRTISPEAIDAQRAWSDETFGPGLRTGGVTAHIAKELDEIRQAPTDLSEWVDVLILAIDGATRAGHSGAALIAAYHAKVAKNRARTWPDWRDFTEDHPIEHVKATQPAPSAPHSPETDGAAP